MNADIEKSIINIWSEVIGGDIAIDKDTNFFSIGGSSMQVITMLYLLKEQYGTEVPLQAFFDAPTVSTLVCELTSAEDEDTISF